MQLRDVLKLAKILAKQCGSEEQLTSIISARYMALVGAHQWRWKKKEMVFPLTDYLTGPDDLAQAKIWISTTANETRLYYSGAWFAASSTVPPGYSHILDQFIGGKVYLPDVNAVYRITGHNTNGAVDDYLIVDEIQPVVTPLAEHSKFTFFRDEFTLPEDVESIEGVWLREFQGVSIELFAADIENHRIVNDPGFKGMLTQEPYMYSVFPEDYIPQVNSRWDFSVFSVLAGPPSMDDGPRLAALCYKDVRTGDLGPITGIEQFSLTAQTITASVWEPQTSYNKVCFLVSKTGQTYKQFADPSCADFYVVHEFDLHDHTVAHIFNEADTTLGTKYPKYKPSSGRMRLKLWPIPDQQAANNTYNLRVDYYRAALPLNHVEDQIILPPHMMDVLMDGVRADISAADGNTEGALFYSRMYQKKLAIALRNDMNYHVANRQTRRMGTPTPDARTINRPIAKFDAP